MTATEVAFCSYSGHGFILPSIETVKDKFKPEIFWSRNLLGNNIFAFVPLKKANLSLQNKLTWFDHEL